MTLDPSLLEACSRPIEAPGTLFTLLGVSLVLFFVLLIHLVFPKLWNSIIDMSDRGTFLLAWNRFVHYLTIMAGSNTRRDASRDQAYKEYM